MITSTTLNTFHAFNRIYTNLDSRPSAKSIVIEPYGFVIMILFKKHLFALLVFGISLRFIK